MFIPHQYKNKGILVPVYGLISFVGSIILFGILQRNVGGLFNKISYAYPGIFGLAVAGLWTNLTCESFYYDSEGIKKVLDIPHEFYWIKMKHWAYIFWVLALLYLIYALVD